MKRLFAGLLALLAALTLCVPAFAENDEPETAAWVISVSGQNLDLQDLLVAPYREGDTVMVPLRAVSEALGYTVGWDPETRAITVDDEYIQKATLCAGSAAVTFEGHLQVIDMSREMENAVPTVIHEGHTYVPVQFFQEFLNDTAIDGTVITVAPSMCEINGTEG